MTEYQPDDHNNSDDSVEEYERYVRNKIEIGIRQADNGETVTFEEAKRILSRWLDQTSST